MVEDVEKCELRLGRRDFLNIVDNQDIDGLIEVDEIVLRVLAHRLRVLRLEHVRRNKQHAHLRVQLLGAHADGIGEVRLSHARRPVEEEGVETAATGIFGNIKPHGARKAVGFAFKEVVERVRGVEIRVEGQHAARLRRNDLLLIFPNLQLAFAFGVAAGFGAHNLIVQPRRLAVSLRQRAFQLAGKALFNNFREEAIGHTDKQFAIGEPYHLQNAEPSAEILRRHLVA